MASSAWATPTTSAITSLPPALPSPRRSLLEIVEASQSAATGGDGSSLTFQVQAMDPQASRLSFSWTATGGTLSAATTTTDTSQVSWTIPACTTSGGTPTVTATVTNAFGLVTSKSFTGTCYQSSCKSVLATNPAASSGVYSIDPDGTGGASRSTSTAT